MSAIEQLTGVINKIGEIANGVQRKISYFVAFGLVASSALAWNLFSQESAVWWNALKCGVVLLPALIWVIVWFVLDQLREAPNLVAELRQDENGVLANLTDFSLKEPEGLRGVFSTIKEFRKEEGFEVVFDTISGVALIANPLFAILALLSMVVLGMLILITPFVLLF